jgi:hypothetical protein
LCVEEILVCTKKFDSVEIDTILECSGIHIRKIVPTCTVWDIFL